MTDKKLTKPPHKPDERDRKRVRTMVGMGMTQGEICAIIGVSKPTLHKYYRADLDVGAAEANAAVAQSLFKQATNAEKPNVIAAIFWLKARAGWRDADPREGLGKKEQKQAAAEEVSNAGRFGAQKAPNLKSVK